MYPQVFGKYVLERELARGGMARVVLATLRGAGGFEKKLVVKQIRDELASDDDFVRRFVLEAKTTVQLAHPNIVPVYELGVELGTYFLAMEFVEGASLAELLRAGGGARSASGGPRALSPEEGAYIGVEVCRALDYAHRRMNVVHRDVTPRNVMVDEEGQIKVIDFGIAAPVETTASGQGVFGSPGHMPPEQMDARQLTPAADVFAVAVLLMELWSGKAPFRRRTREAIDAAMHAPHPRPSDADIRLLPLDDIFASAMALDPRARPQNADDLGRAMRLFLRDIDLGDLARQLGDRVRDFRLHPAPAATEPRVVLQRPASRPTATLAGTKTFAARDGLDGLPVPSLIPGALDVSTRRVDSRAPRALTTAATTSVTPAAGVVTPATAGGADAASASPRESDAGAQETETIATAPLETDPRGESRDSRAQRRVGVARLGIAAAGAVAVAAFFLGRAGTRGAEPAAASTSASARPEPARGASAPSAASAMPAAVPVPSSAPAPPATTTAAASGPSAAPVLSAAAPAPGAAIAERAQLVLLGNGTTVAVDGVTRGPCPARVVLDPGRHAVVFSFPPTGESKSEALTLRGGERRTLRADFTGAAPSIRSEPR